MNHPDPKKLERLRTARATLGWQERRTLTEHIAACPECSRLYDPDPPGPVEAPPAPCPPPAGPDREPPAFPEVPGYALSAELGRGGHATVYEARDRTTDQPLAIKVLHRTTYQPLALSRFRREVLLSRKLPPEHFVAVEEVGLLPDGRPWAAIPFLPTSLAGVWRHQPQPPKEVARLLAHVARGLQAAHERGVVHRDVKPANILLDQAGRPLIADLGLASRSPLEGAGGDRLTPSVELIGTPAYMAPEMIRRKPADPDDPRSDVYSLGVALYEGVTGQPPFDAGEGTPLPDLFEAVRNADPVPPSKLRVNVPRDLDTIVLRCLSKEPAGRFPSAGELAEDLERFARGEPVRSRPPGKLARGWRLVRRYPGRSALAGAVGLLLVALVLVALWGWRNDHLARNALAAEVVAVQRQREAEREREHAARVAAARQGARRGDWVRALPDYDLAIAAGGSAAPRLRVERLTGYLALNRANELTAELDALGREAPAELAPQVKLMRAAWLLCDLSTQARGRALAREALGQRERLFSDADRELAAGLAAGRIGEALKAFRRAAEADPLHYLAASTFATSLAALHEREEARRQAKFLRAVFPYSPIADLTEAVVALSEGDGAALKRHLAAVAGKLPPESRPALARAEQFLLLLLQVHDEGAKNDAGELLSTEDIFQILSLLGQAGRVGGLPNEAALGLPVPAVGLFQARGLEVLSASLAMSRASQEGLASPETLRRLEAITADYPDAEVLLLTAGVHVGLAHGVLSRGDHPAARKHLAAASDLAARALRTPAFPRRSSLHYRARGAVVFADVALLKLASRPGPEPLRRLRENLHLLVDDGRRWAKVRPQILRSIVQTTTAPLRPAEAGDWRLNEPAGKEAFRKRRNDLAALILGFLDDWAIDEPDNPEIRRAREEVTKWAASSGLTE
jgi:hypothetical protein